MGHFAQTNFHYRIRSGQTKRILVHASHTSEVVKDTKAYLRQFGRRNGLLDIGYHFVIERDGMWENTRWAACLGSHAPGLNHDSVGICLASDGEEYPTDAQVEALKEIVGYLFQQFGPLMIQGHTEAQRLKHREACPGFSMDELREDLKPTMNEYTESRSRPGAKENGKDDRQLYQNEGGALSTQAEIILEYLKRPDRTLTNLIALTNLGIGSLSARIAELRAAGHNINSEPCTDFHGRKFVKYSLRPAP